MRGLTFWPEWLWAIRHLGKDVENRGYPPPSLIRGKRIALHAGKKVSGHLSPTSKRVFGAYMNVVKMARRSGIVEEFITNYNGDVIGIKWIAKRSIKGLNFEHEVHDKENGILLGELMFNSIFTGCIVGTVEILPRFGYFDPSGDPVSKWAAENQYQWMMRDIRFLPQPIPCSGKQGLWFVPWDIEEKIVKTIGG